MTNSAYIVTGVRTAGGKKNSKLSGWHPADLGAVVLDEIVKRTAIDPSLIDDVIFGCVSQAGAQAGNVARNAVLSSKTIPLTVPGTTVDRQCGSSQQAIHFAAQAVMSGTQDVVIAGGVEVMSKVPMGASVRPAYEQGYGQPYDGDGIKANYPGKQFSQFLGAEIMAKQWELSREALDKFSLSSHQKATVATQAGKFEKEIVPVAAKSAEHGDLNEMVLEDEGIRLDCTYEGLAGLKNLAEGGRITAGNASQITDGSSAVLIVNDIGLKKLGLKPMARFVGMTLAGTDPVLMLSGPIPATQSLLKKTGVNIEDVGVYEVNEAFAPVPLAWAQDVGADHAKLNVNGGAIALGHPLGSTGSKLATTLVHHMQRENIKYGIQAICEGGGTANAMLLELC